MVGLSQNRWWSPTKFFVLKGKETMKRILGITLALLSMGFVVPAGAAELSNHNSSVTVAANAAPQWQRNRNRRWENRNRRRSVTRTRFVRQGRRLYRETYVVTYWPNGRTD